MTEDKNQEELERELEEESKADAAAQARRLSGQTGPRDHNAERRKAEAASKADQYISKDGGPPKADVREELAGLDRIGYGQRREDLAAALGVPKALLDEEYKAQRQAAEAAAAAAAPKSFLGKKDPEPWEEEVDGDALLDEIVLTINKYLVTPDGAAETMALWSVFTHALDCFYIAPYLAVTSPTIECGKTSVLDILNELTHRGLLFANISPAAIYRAVDAFRPTLLIDEAECSLKDKEELRGILNSRHRRGCGVIRVEGDKHEPRFFSTWGTKAIALVGRLKPSLASRSIHIEMRRKRGSDKVDEVRVDRLGHLLPIKRRAMRWAKDNESALREADPAMPDGVHGRAADNWRPLLAVADLAGAGWPERARRIAVRRSGRLEDDSFGPLLLEDMAKLFAEKNVDRMASVAICEMLAKIEERPWAEYGGVGKDKPITPPKLADILKPFGVVPGTVRLESGGTPKGYKIEQLRDARSRYVSTSAFPPENAATPPQVLEIKGIFENSAATPQCNVAAENAKKPRQGNCCGGVAAKKGGQRGNGYTDATASRRQP